MVENVESSIGQDPANEVTHLGLNQPFPVFHNPFTHTTNKHAQCIVGKMAQEGWCESDVVSFLSNFVGF